MFNNSIFCVYAVTSLKSFGAGAYLPIKSNSAVPLFLQAIIYQLKINGRCAVVLPEGQELFSKNGALVAVREFLMKTCDLKEVIYLPSGIFTYTTIKTCVFYFVKKRDEKTVIKTEIKMTKTQKICIHLIKRLQNVQIGKHFCIINV